jgi:hypothetical protein
VLVTHFVQHHPGADAVASALPNLAVARGAIGTGHMAPLRQNPFVSHLPGMTKRIKEPVLEYGAHLSCVLMNPIFYLKC